MKKIKVEFHGAGREVGRSCIELTFPGKERILLDAGLKPMNGESNLYPVGIKRPKKIDLAFTSHAHLDHIGALPWLCNQGLDCPIICPDLTRQIAEVSLYDAWSIEKEEKEKKGESHYVKGWVARALNLMKDSWKGSYGDVYYRLIPNAHIPGSVCIYIEYKGKSILYTGDIRGGTSRLMTEACLFPKADILIIDSTYGGWTHYFNLEEIVEKFKERIIKVLNQGGSVILPGFAIERIQEIILILAEMELPVPVYFDGRMALEITDIIANSLANSRLHEAGKRVIRVENWMHREAIKNSQAIFLSTSGMINGGPVNAYIETFWWSIRSSLMFTGYQAEGTKGRKLLDTGLIEINGGERRVEFGVEKFDFSAHADMSALEVIINQVSPRVVIAQHGDEFGVEAVVEYARSQNIEAEAPANGDIILL